MVTPKFVGSVSSTAVVDWLKMVVWDRHPNTVVAKLFSIGLLLFKA